MQTVLGCWLYGTKRTLEATMEGVNRLTLATYVFVLPRMT